MERNVTLCLNAPAQSPKDEIFQTLGTEHDQEDQDHPHRKWLVRLVSLCFRLALWGVLGVGQIQVHDASFF